MHRFFVSPGAFVRQADGTPQGVTFDAAVAHQLRNVLRLRPGARVVVLDDSGWEYQVELTDLGSDVAAGRVCEGKPVQSEPRASLTLYQSLLKGDRFEWILQKGTELGVTAFVPIFARRTVVRNAGRVQKKRPRWERIVREAAEQSGRGRLPRLAPPLPFAKACRESIEVYDRSWIPWEGTACGSLASALRSLAPHPKSIALWIGPEGGFEEQEIALAGRCGIRAVTLGPRILRAETAALAAMTIVLSELGEMG